MTTFSIPNAVKNPEILETATFTRPPSTAETKSKIKLGEWEAAKNHIRDGIITLFALGSVSYFVYYCFVILNNTNSSADDKKWAMSLIALITSSIVGYLVGKSTNK